MLITLDAELDWGIAMFIGLMGVKNDGTLVTPSGVELFKVPPLIGRLVQKTQHWIAEKTWSDSIHQKKWFAYSQALAFESLDLREKFDADKEVFNGVTFDDFEKYAKIVACKVAHNLQNGFVMDKNDDPLNYGDK